MFHPNIANICTGIRTTNEPKRQSQKTQSQSLNSLGSPPLGLAHNSVDQIHTRVTPLKTQVAGLT